MLGNSRSPFWGGGLGGAPGGAVAHHIGIMWWCLLSSHSLHLFVQWGLYPLLGNVGISFSSVSPLTLVFEVLKDSIFFSLVIDRTGCKLVHRGGFHTVNQWLFYCPEGETLLNSPVALYLHGNLYAYAVWRQSVGCPGFPESTTVAQIDSLVTSSVGELNETRPLTKLRLRVSWFPKSLQRGLIRYNKQ